MTPDELERVIAGFRAGGGVSSSDYHAGEMRSWGFESPTERFIHETRSTSWDGVSELRYTEAEFRARIKDDPFEYWSRACRE